MNFFERLTKSWNTLGGIATWLMVIITAFFVPPPVGSGQFGGDGAIAGFARFALPIFIGLLMAPMSRWDNKRHTWLWWKTAVGALLLSAIAFFAYQWLTTMWTCDYNGGRVVFGPESGITGEMREWLKDNRTTYPNPQDWIDVHAGGKKLESIWTRDSMAGRCAVLAAVYLFSLPLFGLAVMCVVQATYCNSRRS